MMAAAAVVGCLSDLNTSVATGKTHCGIEATGGGRTAQYHDTARAGSQGTSCEQREGRTPEATADAEQGPTHRGQRESHPEWTEHIQGIARMKRSKPRRSLSDHFEHEAALIVINPRNAHRSPEQGDDAGSAAQLRELSRTHVGCKMREAHGELHEAAGKVVERGHLAALVACTREVRLRLRRDRHRGAAVPTAPAR